MIKHKLICHFNQGIRFLVLLILRIHITFLFQFLWNHVDLCGLFFVVFQFNLNGSCSRYMKIIK